MDDVLDDATTALLDTANSVKGFFKSPEERESNKLFHQLDKDNSKSATQEEIAQFVASNAALWAMLSMQFDLPEDQCQEAATQVAMELATGLRGDQAMQATITKHQFFEFRKKYVIDPQGAQEFFHRAIFAAFDKDNNARLEEEEVDQFLNKIFKVEAALKGDVQQLLPSREKLRKAILEKLDVEKQGSLSFEVVRRIIHGEAAAEADAVLKAEAKRLAAEEEARKAEEERLAAKEEARKAEEERLAAETAAVRKIQHAARTKTAKKINSSKPEDQDTVATEQEMAEKEPESDCVFCEWLASLVSPSQPTLKSISS